MSKKEPLAHAVLVMTEKGDPYITGILVCAKVLPGNDTRLSRVQKALGDKVCGHVKPLFTKGEVEAAKTEAAQYQAAMAG